MSDAARGRTVWTLLLVFHVFAFFGCSNFYVTDELVVKRFAALRAYGFSAFFSCSAYYFANFNRLREFFVSTGTRLNLIFFEFNLYWSVIIVELVLTILSEPRVALWYERVLREIASSKDCDQKTLGIVLIVKCLIVSTSLVCFKTASTLIRNQPDLSVWGIMMYTYLNIVVCLIVLQFTAGVTFLLFLSRKLRRDLTRHLRGWPSCTGRIAAEYAEFECARKMREMTSSYHHYYLFAVELNRCFGKQLLLITLLTFLEFTYSLYYLLVPPDTHLFLNVKGRMAFPFFYFGFYLVQFLDYTMSCEFLNDENQRILSLVGNAFAEVENKRLLESLEIFICQNAHLKLEMTASGFFSIDHSLIYKMTGLVTSTLVILFQFSHLAIITGNETDPGNVVTN